MTRSICFVSVYLRKLIYIYSYMYFEISYSVILVAYIRFENDEIVFL